MKDSSNIIGFLEDEQFVKFGKELECSTADLYSGYCHWCALNSTDIMKKEMFNLWLKQNHEKYKIEYCANVQSHENSKRAIKSERIFTSRPYFSETTSFLYSLRAFVTKESRFRYFLRKDGLKSAFIPKRS